MKTLQDDITGLNKIFKEQVAFNQFNKMSKIIEEVSPRFAMSASIKEVSSIYGKHTGLLTPMLPMKGFLSELNNVYELVNPFKSILDYNILFKSDMNKFTDEIKSFSSSLSVLNQLSISYETVIGKQKEAFNQISYLRPFEKRFLLRHEKNQKQSIVLGNDDLENTDIINFNVKNTIAFINSIASIDNQDIDTTKVADNIENELIERLNSHGKGYLEILEGAKQAASSDNPEKVRHTVTSLRELSTHILHDLSPDENVKKWSNKKDDFHDDRPTRKCRLAYIFRNLEQSKVSSLINNEIKFIVDFFNFFNRGTHELIPKLDFNELDYLICKLESTLLLLLKYSLNK